MEHPMAGAIRNIGGQSVHICAAGDAPIARESDALDRIGEAFEVDVAWIAIPVERLSPDFFRLRTGSAGAFLRKLVNYGHRVAIVGDFSRGNVRARLSPTSSPVRRQCLVPARRS